MGTRRPLFAFITLILAAAPAHAREALPGLLDAAAIRAGRAHARQQKKDAQAAVVGHARDLGYSDAQITRALTPSMLRRGRFQVGLKDGTVVEFPWYRIGFAENRLANWHKSVDSKRHETNKGGVRLHHGVFVNEVYALALKMDTKLATARDSIGTHPFRGAKGGIGAGRVVKVGSRYDAKVGDYVDPASPVFDRAEIMSKFARSYRARGGAVGPGLDIQAGDVNTKAAEMKVLAQTYGSKSTPSAGVSGKRVRYHRDGSINPKGGIEYRAISTGDGVWMATRHAAKRVGLNVRGATVVAQGWGEVGRAFGHAALDDGARVIAIQELWKVNGQKTVGTLHHPLGAQAKPAQIRQWLKEVEGMRASGKDLGTYQGGKLMRHFKPGQDASAVRADIVGINALGGVLNDRTVPAYVRSGTHQGRRKILAEGANLAETSAGARQLDRHNNRVLTITGDLANLGGVHVSDLEAVQNAYRLPVTSRQARHSLQGTIRSGWNRAMKIAKKQGISERKAIEMAAVDGMMKRSLRLSSAPRAPMERRAFSKGTLGKMQPRRRPAGLRWLPRLGR